MFKKALGVLGFFIIIQFLTPLSALGTPLESGWNIDVGGKFLYNSATDSIEYSLRTTDEHKADYPAVYPPESHWLYFSQRNVSGAGIDDLFLNPCEGALFATDDGVEFIETLGLDNWPDDAGWTTFLGEPIADWCSNQVVVDPDLGPPITVSFSYTGDIVGYEGQTVGPFEAHIFYGDISGIARSAPESMEGYINTITIPAITVTAGTSGENTASQTFFVPTGWAQENAPYSVWAQDLENFGVEGVQVINSLSFTGTNSVTYLVELTEALKGIAETDLATCENSNGELSWALCPLVLGGAENVGGLLGFVSSALTLELGPAEASNGMYAVWSAFRLLANIFFVIILLIIVYAQATGSVLDAYSVKRMMPRLAISAIAVQLSYFFSSEIVTIVNEMGQGLAVIINAVVDISLSPADIAQALTILVVAGAVAGAASFIGLFAMGPFVLGFLIILIAAILTIYIRGLLIVSLAALSPIAMVAWILPGTDGFFKFWWQTFSKTLLMYPMIVLLIESGKIMAVAASGGDGTNLNWQGLIIYFVPYLMIPLTFKFAGSAIAGIGGFVDNKKRGIIDRAHRSGEPKRAAKRAEFLSGTRTKGGNKFSRGFDNLGMAFGVGTKSIFSPRGFKGRLETARAAAEAARGEDPAFQHIAKNSRALAAHALGGGYVKEQEDKLRGKLASGELNQAQYDQQMASWAQARSLAASLPNTTAQRQASLTALSGTSFEFAFGEEGFKQLQRAVVEIVGGDVNDIDHTNGTYNGKNAGAYGTLMNQQQAQLKNSGRWDQAMVNFGQGYDFQKTWSKANTYSIATGTPEAIQAASTEIARLSATGNPEDMKKAIVMHKEMEAMKSQSVGAIRDKIVEHQTSAVGQSMDQFYDSLYNEQPKLTPAGAPDIDQYTGKQKILQTKSDAQKAIDLEVREYKQRDPNLPV